MAHLAAEDVWVIVAPSSVADMDADPRLVASLNTLARVYGATTVLETAAALAQLAEVERTLSAA